jgi:predicted ATPase/class 3 adenylate cyclase/Tfp pilus assembly protein PilF
MPALPAGTITFLFSDIEGSTRLWEQHPAAMKTALARHDMFLREAIEANGGAVFKTIGDAFCAAFPNPLAALSAAVTAQRALHAADWGAIGALRVRMAIHTGTAEERGGDYFGPPLNRVARLLPAAHGGQTLLSLATVELIRDQLPADVSLHDLGEHRLKDPVRPERVFQLIVSGLPADFPALKSLDAFPHNLPIQLTSFIGREREVAEVKRLLTPTPFAPSPSPEQSSFRRGGGGWGERVRLLTLMGTGGVGKTRLALQAAADLLEQFPDGVWLVELAPLPDPSLVPQAVASALCVREESGRRLLTTLTDYLCAKNLLLILDNCEHVVAACAQLAEHLLHGCSHLRILATSRAALGIGGETTLLVPSLSLPDPRILLPFETLSQYEAVRLFIDRALAALPGFSVTNQNAPAVAQICHRLDGIPLAIELAAARVKVLAVEQILARLSDRFRLLTGGSRTALPRQQTLSALIDWSYDLLAENERVLLRRLSVFAGGWSLEAAEAVASDEWRVASDDKHDTRHPATPLRTGPSGVTPQDVLDLLTQLVDKSLVLTEGQNSETRYRMSETIREYGQDKLLQAEEAARLRQRHCDYFCRLAETANPQLRGPQQTEWLNRLEREHDNLRAALGWSLEGEEVEIALRLSGALWRFWLMRGYLSEGRTWLDGALARVEAERDSAQSSASARAKVFDGAGALALTQRDYKRARACFERGLELFRQLGDKAGMGTVFNSLGAIAQDQANYAQAQSFFEASLALRREIGEQWGIASSLNNLGLVALQQGDYERAHAFFEENLNLRRALGDKRGLALALTNLGVVALYRGDYAQAAALCTEGLAFFRELGNKRGIAAALANLGRAALYQSDYARARALQTESLTLFQQLGDQGGIAECLEALAGAAGAQGQPLRAARLFGAAEALREKIGVPLSPADRPTYDRTVAAARAQLDASAFTTAWTAGRALTMEQAVSEALEKRVD